MKVTEEYIKSLGWQEWPNGICTQYQSPDKRVSVMFGTSNRSSDGATFGFNDELYMSVGTMDIETVQEYNTLVTEVLKMKDLILPLE